jgi:hypothetical protein
MARNNQDPTARNNPQQSRPGDVVQAPQRSSAHEVFYNPDPRTFFNRLNYVGPRGLRRAENAPPPTRPSMAIICREIQLELTDGQDGAAWLVRRLEALKAALAYEPNGQFAALGSTAFQAREASPNDFNELNFPGSGWF